MTSTTYWLQGIDDREWIFTFPFTLIPMQSVPIPSILIPKFKSYSHSRGIPVGLFPFPSSHARTAKQYSVNANSRQSNNRKTV